MHSFGLKIYRPLKVDRLLRIYVHLQENNLFFDIYANPHCDLFIWFTVLYCLCMVVRTGTFSVLDVLIHTIFLA